jgi:hypothetical protein
MAATAREAQGREPHHTPAAPRARERTLWDTTTTVPATAGSRPPNAVLRAWSTRRPPPRHSPCSAVRLPTSAPVRAPAAVSPAPDQRAGTDDAGLLIARVHHAHVALSAARSDTSQPPSGSGRSRNRVRMEPVQRRAGFQDNPAYVRNGVRIV